MKSTTNNQTSIFDDIDPNKKQTRRPLKATNGKRCLTKCYSNGEMFVHPVLLELCKVEYGSICAVDPTRSTHGATLGIVDNCKPEDNLIYREPNELEELLLGYYFDPDYFLSYIYGLNTFDDVIYWTLDNDYLPFDTIKRVHNCAWKIYGNKLDKLSIKIYEYYYDIATTRWLKDYAKTIKKKYSYNLTTRYNKTTDNDNVDEIEGLMKVIIDDFFDFDFFCSCIKQYINDFVSTWDTINSHYRELKKYVFNKLLDKIIEK